MKESRLVHSLIGAFLTVFVLPSFIFPSTIEATDPVHYDVLADTFIHSQAPGYNYGRDREMFLNYWGGESYAPETEGQMFYYHKWLLIKPDISRIPRNATIETAKLRLHIKKNSGFAGCQYRVSKITSNWNEGSVTWSNRPTSVNAGVTGVFFERNDNVNIDITNLVKEWYSGRSTNYGVIIADREISQDCSFSTREGPNGDRPWLSVRFTTPTPTPTRTPTPRLVRFISPTPTPRILRYISPTPTTRIVRFTSPTPTPRIFRYISPTPTITSLPVPPDDAETPTGGQGAPGGTNGGNGGIPDEPGVDSSDDENIDVDEPVEDEGVEEAEEQPDGGGPLNWLGNLFGGGVNTSTTDPTSDPITTTLTEAPPAEDAGLEDQLKDESSGEMDITTQEEDESTIDQKESHPLVQLFKGTASINRALLPVVVIFIIIFAVFLILRKKTGEKGTPSVEETKDKDKENTEEKDAEHHEIKKTKDRPEETEVKKKHPLRTIVFILAGIFGLALLLQILPFAGMYFYSEFMFRDSEKLDKIANKAIEENLPIIDRPVAKVEYKEVSEEVKNATFDCQKYGKLPYTDKNYLCQNLYQTDEQNLKAKVSQENPERVFLYGQYINFDCFTSAAIAKDPVAECYQAAKFLDNWQIEKVSEILGTPLPDEKIYYFLTETLEETKELCQKGGVTKDNFGACAIYENGPIAFIPPVGKQGGSFFLVAGTAYFFERDANSDPKPITYKSRLIVPGECYLVDNHELIHILSRESFEDTLYWFEEGLISLMSNTLLKEICAPGYSLSKVTKEGVDGTVTEVIDPFIPDTLDLEEPLSSKLVQLSEDNQCRKGVYMQVANNISKGGTFYLKLLYRSLAKYNLKTDTDIAKAVWDSSGKENKVKDFLQKNQCSF